MLGLDERIRWFSRDVLIKNKFHDTVNKFFFINQWLAIKWHKKYSEKYEFLTNRDTIFKIRIQATTTRMIWMLQIDEILVISAT